MKFVSDSHTPLRSTLFFSLIIMQDDDEEEEEEWGEGHFLGSAFFSFTFPFEFEERSRCLIAILWSRNVLRARNPVNYDCTRKDIKYGPFWWSWPSVGSNLPSPGKWSGTVSLIGKWPALPWEVVIHFPGLGITSQARAVTSRVWAFTSQVRVVTSRLWAFTSRVWAHFPYRVIPSISQGGSKCPSWCSHIVHLG